MAPRTQPWLTPPPMCPLYLHTTFSAVRLWELSLYGLIFSFFGSNPPFLAHHSISHSLSCSPSLIPVHLMLGTMCPPSISSPIARYSGVFLGVGSKSRPCSFSHSRIPHRPFLRPPYPPHHICPLHSLHRLFETPRRDRVCALDLGLRGSKPRPRSAGCAPNDLFYFAGSFSTMNGTSANNIALYTQALVVLRLCDLVDPL